ncbi:type III pantothenate kinase [Nitratiruptor sp. SB155-2]|uniref:type III pantothenate kinase n=1 Tax=Nitratiruptor sp. (strain SB155-2) TaxID=387092 RepID=UPI00015870A9|nr:type III pantothenate kinase [Nitratiruptor sp. SB155-2]BAF70279.1 transcriptional activator, Baf family [Nitratiruptor sp. SB155-2]
MLLCDIGNTNIKIYNDGLVQIVSQEELLSYQDQRLFYLSVHPSLQSFPDCKKWINLEAFVSVKSSYNGLGVDRKALCSLVDEGTVIDAGSAITVDVMQDNIHTGGFIYPGKKAFFEAFRNISPRLDFSYQDILKNRLPQETRSALSYGFIAPLVALVEKLPKPWYVTGGDGGLLLQYLPDAIYRPHMIFEAMKQIIQRNGLC